MYVYILSSAKCQPFCFSLVNPYRKMWFKDARAGDDAGTATPDWHPASFWMSRGNLSHCASVVGLKDLDFVDINGTHECNLVRMGIMTQCLPLRHGDRDARKAMSMPCLQISDFLVLPEASQNKRCCLISIRIFIINTRRSHGRFIFILVSFYPER